MVNGSRLLNLLNSCGHHAVTPHAERVHLAPRGQMICDRDAVSRFVYFPTDAIVSHAVALYGGTRAHLGLTGGEGMIGTLAAVRMQPSLTDVIVIVPGDAWRMGADALRHVAERDDAIGEVLNRYAKHEAAAAAISATCIVLHSLQQRLCRMLLTLGDQLGERIVATHHLLALLVGTTRPSVTRVIDALAAAGAVAHTRGVIVLRDDAALLSGSCDCRERITASLEEVYAPSGRPVHS